jgi:hypothetical protein
VEGRIAFEVLNILNRAGREVIYDMDLIAAREQSLRQMGANKSGPTGYQYTHMNPRNPALLL